MRSNKFTVSFLTEWTINMLEIIYGAITAYSLTVIVYALLHKQLQSSNIPPITIGLMVFFSKFGRMLQ